MSTTVTELLEGIDGFRTQLCIWTYVVQGDVLEPGALIAEGKAPPEWPMWDRDASYLNHVERFIDGNREPTPYRWALPWVTELLMLQDGMRPYRPWLPFEKAHPEARESR
jgi:hypothetical protein